MHFIRVLLSKNLTISRILPEDDKALTTPSNSLVLAPFPQARAAAKQTRDNLDALLNQKVGKYTSEDTSLVVFGSLARGEWTDASDVDWTYLIDGQANSDHLT